MISSTTRNYSGRKVDFSLFPSMVTSAVPADMELGEIPKVITGKAKGSQSFLRALMTPLGHFGADPGFGSEFPNKVTVGGIVVVEDLPNLFATESLRVIENVFDPMDAPDDERVDTATLEDYTLGRGSLSMVVRLTFRDGDSGTPLHLPINLEL